MLIFKDFFYYLNLPYKYIRGDINEYLSLKEKIKNKELEIATALEHITKLCYEYENVCSCVTKVIFYTGKNYGVKTYGNYINVCSNFNGKPCQKENCVCYNANVHYHNLKQEIEDLKKVKNNFFMNKYTNKKR